MYFLNSELNKRQKSKETSIPNSIIYDSSISPAARMVLIYLHTKPYGWKGSCELIAKELDVGIYTIKKTIAELRNTEYHHEYPFIKGNRIVKLFESVIADYTYEIDEKE